MEDSIQARRRLMGDLVPRYRSRLAPNEGATHRSPKDREHAPGEVPRRADTGGLRLGSHAPIATLPIGGEVQLSVGDTSRLTLITH
jgi:hypothetical protein